MGLNSKNDDVCNTVSPPIKARYSYGAAAAVYCSVKESWRLPGKILAVVVVVCERIRVVGSASHPEKIIQYQFLKQKKRKKKSIH